MVVAVHDDSGVVAAVTGGDAAVSTCAAAGDQPVERSARCCRGQSLHVSGGAL